MPEGERAFVQSRGPRTTLALRVSVETEAALVLAAAELRMSKTGYATCLLELWAQEWLAAVTDGGTDA